jgi:hypothetical protein
MDTPMQSITVRLATELTAMSDAEFVHTDFALNEESNLYNAT